VLITVRGLFAAILISVLGSPLNAESCAPQIKRLRELAHASAEDPLNADLAYFEALRIDRSGLSKEELYEAHFLLREILHFVDE